MTIPKSKILSVKNGFGAAAELHSNSPTSTQIINLSLNSNKEQTNNEPSEQVSYPPNQPNPYTQLVDDPNTPNDERLEAIIKSKDNIINAYSLLLTIAENNPVIVNKFLVAKASELAQLIKLLTEADDVQINLNLDVDCSCVGSVNYSSVDKIYIVKNGETLNFKYSYPNANKILDDHHVSVKFVIDA